MAREIALIRTHFFNQRIKNAIQFLSGHFGDDVYVVCPDRVIEKLSPGATGGFSRFIPLHEAALDALDLPRPQKWEWVCGDYALYRARADCPWADRIWLIEYDIVFNFDRASDFFAQFQDDDADLLAFGYREADAAWAWRQLMLPLSDSVMRCFFSPIRLSARALDHLLDRRRALAHTVAADAWPNDEAFVATTLTNGDFHCRDISDGVTSAESFSWSRPHSIRAVKAKGPDGLVYHPVVAGDAYLKKARQFLQQHPERFSEIAATLKEECGDDRYEMVRDLVERRATAAPDAVESVEVRIVSSTIDGHEVRFAVENETDIIQSHHAAGRFYEWEEMSIIRQHFPAGGVFCDIGANVGNHSVFAGLFLGASRILAFEPNPAALRLLRLNILLNGLSGVVDLGHVGYGLGSAPGHASMAAPEQNLGGNTLDIADPSGTVEIRTGDSCLAGMAIDFLKIDVEGMEMAVLEGLAETIRQRRPPIFIEVWDEAANALQHWCAANHYEVVDSYRRYAKCKNFMLRPSLADI